MIRYVLRRAVTMLLALWLIITITFIIMHAIPGGPFSREKKVPQVVLENLNKRYQLDEPYWKQYSNYLSGIMKLDFGPSFRYDYTVNEIISRSFPVSAVLGVMAVCLALFFGVLLGIASAYKQNQWIDHGAMLLATLGFSVPSFILSSLLIYFFSYRLRWLPPAMWGSWQQAILPVLALAALPMAFIARVMRSSILEVLQQDYMLTARAKGLSTRHIFLNHVFKNSFLPVLTYLGYLTASIFTGSFVVESIFAIPGLGRYFVSSVLNRDYTLILGLTVFYAVFLMMINLIVDIVYMLIDPRIKLADRSKQG